jgi:hypothetical protein
VLTSLVRRRGWSLTIGTGVFAVLTLAVWSGAAWTTHVTGPWYGEWHRLLAVVGMLAAPLVGIGADMLATVLLRTYWQSWDRPVLARAVVATAVVIAVVLGVSAARYAVRGQSIINTAWHGPQLVTADDMAVFHEMGTLVPDRAQVLNNWQDGSTWMLSMGGARPLLPYAYSVSLASSVGQALLSAGDVQQNPQLCQVMLDERVTYALVKNVTVAGSDNSFKTLVEGDPTLYQPVLKGAQITLYKVNVPVLRTCAAGPAGS